MVLPWGAGVEGLDWNAGSFFLLASHGDAHTPGSPTLQCRALTPTSLGIFEPKSSGSAAKPGAFFPLQTHGGFRRHQPAPKASTVSGFKQKTTRFPVAEGWPSGRKALPTDGLSPPLWPYGYSPELWPRRQPNSPGAPRGCLPSTFPLSPEQPRLSPLPTGCTFVPAMGTNSSALPVPGKATLYSRSHSHRVPGAPRGTVNKVPASSTCSF